ncbi:hypothetical protein DMA15_16340 [Streptomyces sp. WAC 01529]|uniref:hypothetical protein n=1 Tax=Streptomyces sp. WAC 01529 TaxID=2203205 RepID=UPI000F70A391|nr:hypothetical protein [Streptomyces sp. WAC 01529]AZM53947.1 hypothetical protein DMA15_16340 [Streptomyces sp. WAC 01529]
MNTGLKITAFTAAVAATFGTAYGVGKGVGPVTDRTPAAQHHEEAAQHDEEEGAGHGEGTAPGGLQISERGYTLDLRTPRIEAARRDTLRFAVVEDSTGRGVTAYEKEHDKELHLIVASRDLTTYRHLHPTRAADGTWSTPVELPEAGGYRVFADFRPEGAKEGLTLGADLAVAGESEPRELPAPSTTAKVDGYDVTLKGGLKTGTGGDLTLNVAKNGRPVTDLQPYLGAYGHLVALRSGDLAYLHVHPNGEPGDGRTKAGPGVSFMATVPSAGAYRLFLDFKHEGKVRTAAFTVHAGGGGHAEKDGGGHAEKGGGGHAEKSDGHQH